jgi:hypothetical protein
MKKVSFEKSRYIFFGQQSKLKRPLRDLQNPLGAFIQDLPGKSLS